MSSKINCLGVRREIYVGEGFVREVWCDGRGWTTRGIERFSFVNGE